MDLNDVDLTVPGQREAYRDAIGFARAASAPDLDGAWSVWSRKNDTERLQLTLCLANLLGAVLDDDTWADLLTLIEADPLAPRQDKP